MGSEIPTQLNQKRDLTICPECDTSQNQSGANHEFVSDESPSSWVAPSERLFNLADFRIVAAPFAQTSLSILLDTHVREGQDDLEVSPFPARLPLRRPRAVSFTVKLRIERQEGSSSSARFSPLPRGLTFCPTYYATRPRP